MANPEKTQAAGLNPTPEIRCPQCSARIMGPDTTGDLVIRGTRVLRLHGDRFQAKCAMCKTWTILPVGVVG